MKSTMLKILTGLMIAAWFVVVLGFVSSESEKVICNRIEVILSDTTHSRFITEADVRNMLEKTGLSMQGYPISQIRTRELEQQLETNPYIRNAEVSTDISGKLDVWIEQRVPQVRIMPDGQTGFYLDREGHVLPLSDRYVPLTLLVSGHISGPAKNGELNAQILEILRFSNYLSSHPFWQAQIVQLYVDRRGEYELIPRVGSHQILFGNMDQWEKKLANLELLYRQGFSKYGWNTYETINLKYTNQVICSKR